MTKPSNEQDAHLLGRVAAGDQAAFAELFDRHSSVVLGVLTRLLGRRGEAEEILQEAFFQAWEQAARFDSRRSSVRGWLLMMARSRALDRLRSGQARTRREESVGREPPGGRVAEPVGTEELEESERARWVRGGLAGLPEEQRRCVELAYYEGLTHTQIAERLEQPLGTVKSRLLLGMNKLRRAMTPYYER